jgi:hypothetical protein
MTSLDVSEDSSDSIFSLEMWQEINGQKTSMKLVLLAACFLLFGFIVYPEDGGN